MPVAWHPDHVVGWCLDEDEKREIEKSWSTFSQS